MTLSDFKKILAIFGKIGTNGERKKEREIEKAKVFGCI